MHRRQSAGNFRGVIARPVAGIVAHAARTGSVVALAFRGDERGLDCRGPAEYRPLDHYDGAGCQRKSSLATATPRGAPRKPAANFRTDGGAAFRTTFGSTLGSPAAPERTPMPNRVRLI